MKRQSNIELLRCLSMFMVLLLHSSFLAFGMPDSEAVQSNPWLWGGRIAQQGIGIVAVDVFVLISGWFSIKPKKESICSFLFQIAFLKLLSYVVFVSFNLIEVNKESLVELLMLHKDQGWFIKAYLLLYILSPVLNTFAQNASKELFKKTLILYWCLIFILGWVFDATAYINDGYSVVPFIGLYLLARYMRIWQPKWTCFTLKKDLCIYALCVTCFWAVIFSMGLIGLNQTAFIAWKLCSYVCPITVFGAAALLLIFSKMDIKYNSLINICGRGCFSIYLLHAMWGYWFKILNFIGNGFNGLGYMSILFSFLIIVFAGCILVDLLRVKAWSIISKNVFNK